jgi:hypothetical protein
LGSPESKPDFDEVDAGWDDDEDDVDSGWGDDAALDSGWDDLDAAAEPTTGTRKVLTPEEREARAARAAARKDRQRAKTAEKGERRKARAAATAAKQKKKQKKTARPTVQAKAAPVDREPATRTSPEDRRPDRTNPVSGVVPARARRPAIPGVVIVVLVAVLAAGVFGLLLARR